MKTEQGAKQANQESTQEVPQPPCNTQQTNNQMSAPVEENHILDVSQFLRQPDEQVSSPRSESNQIQNKSEELLSSKKQATKRATKVIGKRGKNEDGAELSAEETDED
jgi:hypothetical protein